MAKYLLYKNNGIVNLVIVLDMMEDFRRELESSAVFIGKLNEWTCCFTMFIGHLAMDNLTDGLV